MERIGYKHLIAHLRTFCELLIFEFSKSGGTGFVAKCIDNINNLVWKYNIIALDRFILCMALRTNEGSEAQVRRCNYRERLKSFSVLLSMTKAAPGRNTRNLGKGI